MACCLLGERGPHCISEAAWVRVQQTEGAKPAAQGPGHRAGCAFRAMGGPLGSPRGDAWSLTSTRLQGTGECKAHKDQWERPMRRARRQHAHVVARQHAHGTLRILKKTSAIRPVANE